MQQNPRIQTLRDARRLAATAALCAGMMFAALFTATGQVPQARVTKGWNFPMYEAGRINALLTGNTAERVAGGVVQLRQFRMITFREGDTNKIEMIVEAPDTFFHAANRVAWSDGPLKVLTANTNYVIQGKGFEFKQEGMSLVISNDVKTSITSTNSQGEAGPPVHIASDRFRFEQMDAEKTSRAVYTGNVRVDDPDMELTSGQLIVDLPQGVQRPRQITALENVAIMNLRDQSRATGEQAVYSSVDGADLVTLTGNPVWKDASREGRADRFVLDRNRRTILAEGNAYMKLPQSAIAQPDLANAVPATENDPAIEEQMAEVFSDNLTIQLPDGNSPIRGIVAERNVRILSHNGESRAFGERAVYTEESGELILTGTPVWQFRDTLLEADELALGGSDQGLRGVGTVFLRMRADARHATGAPEPSQTNQFIEIRSDTLDYRSNRAVFQNNVRSRMLDGDSQAGTLDAAMLTVYFTPENQIERLEAARNVLFAQQFDSAASEGSPARVTHRKVTADLLTADRAPEGEWLQNLRASGNVSVDETTESGGVRLTKSLAAEAAAITYADGTDRIDRLVAEKNVVLQQVELAGGNEKRTRITGQHLVYSGEPGAEQAVITGNPVAQTPDTIITNAEILLWDGASGKFRAKGGRYDVRPIGPPPASAAAPRLR